MNGNEVISPTTDVYSSDGKLNFLCSLDLIPTPLIKKCPNATKRWLRAVPSVATTVQDIGIHSKYEDIDTSSAIYEEIDSPSTYNAIPTSETTDDEINNSIITCDIINNSTEMHDKIDNSIVSYEVIDSSDVKYDKIGNSAIRSEKIDNSTVRYDKRDNSTVKYDDIDTSPTKIDFLAVSMYETTECSVVPLTAIHLPENSSPKFPSSSIKNQHCAFDFDQNKCIYTTSHQNSLVTPTCSLIPLRSLDEITSENVLTITDGRYSSTPVGTTSVELLVVSNDRCLATPGGVSTVNNMSSVPYVRTLSAADAITENTFAVSHARFLSPSGGISLGCTLDASNKISGIDTTTSMILQNIISEQARLQNILSEQARVLKILDVQTRERQQTCFQNATKKSNELRDTVMNEIVSQEINQTVFAKASIGKTQGYLSELLRNSKLLEVKDEKEYRRTRHNLDKIQQFLKKTKCERKRIYSECSSTKANELRPIETQPKQKRTSLSADVKQTLFDYFRKHDRKLCNVDFQCLSSQLNLDVQSVKVFHKNWKQRTKMKSK